jgi:septin family protein
MKRLGSRVNLIPVIAKADTLTPTDLQKFKVNVSKKKRLPVFLYSADSL